MRKLKGIVVSNKMQKTALVEVTRWRKHPRYLKYYRITKKFKAHDENSEYNMGENVIIQETRPLSKTKRWRIIGKVVAKEGLNKENKE